MRLKALIAAIVLPSLQACAASHDASAARADSIIGASASATMGSPELSDSARQAGGLTPAPAIAGGVSTAGIPPAVMQLRTSLGTPIRGLYVNRFAAQSRNRMKQLIELAESTEINALVIDVKDEFGLNWNSDDPMLRKNAGTQTKLPNLKALADSINAHGILPVARIVVFKDSVAARMNPQSTIRKADGSPWRDHKGLTWVNPYANAIWEYNFRVAEEAVRMGFGEVQFDYIRFPEPYKSLPAQVFPEQRGRTKQQALSEFLDEARRRLHRMGVRSTADIFGLVTTVRGSLEVGQEWEKLAKSADVLLPMVYPSHYPRGSFGIRYPNAEPYRTIHIAISRARERNEALGIRGEQVRPWLQAFTLGSPQYGSHEVSEQKRAVYDSGFEGWILWHPGSRYEHVVGGLEKTLVPRARKPPVPAQKAAD